MMPHNMPVLHAPLRWPVPVGLALAIHFVLTSATALAMHPFHTSVAELDWNSQTARWEISLRIHAGDLELALQREFGDKLPIESPACESRIQSYLASRFLLTSQAHAEKLAIDPHFKPAPVDGPFPPADRAKSATEDCGTIHWVGSELEGNWLWIYFEMTPPETQQPLGLVSQLLMEVNQDQINILSLRKDGKRITRQTNRLQIWTNVATAPLTPANLGS